MDVRSADTTNLAAKTAELEKTKPLVHRPLGLAEDVLIAQAPVGTNGHVSRPKPPKDPRQQKKHDHAAQAPLDQESDEAAEEVEEPTTDEGEEHHHLDVKA